MSRQIPNDGFFNAMPGFLGIALVGFGSWVLVAVIMLIRFVLYGHA